MFPTLDNTRRLLARARPDAGLAIIAALALLGCSGEGDGDASSSVAPAWQRDFFDRATLVAGKTILTEKRHSATRGTWDIVSSNGRAQKSVRDPERGGFPWASILIGGEPGGADERSIGVTLPADLEPDRLSVRFLAAEGESLTLKPVLVGRDGGIPGDAVEHTGTGAPLSLDFDLPDVEGATNLILEIGGACQRPAFTEIVLIETIPASSTIARSVQGPSENQRNAIGLGGRARLACAIDLSGPSQVTLSCQGDRETSGPLKIKVLRGEEVVAQKSFRFRKRWSQLALDVTPREAGEHRLVVENGAKSGVWLAEERVDSGSPPPSIFLITSDTHRGDHVGPSSPDAPVRTPALARLSSEGINFTNCFSPTNITNPSHMSLMTGLPLRDTRIINNMTALSRAATTLAEEFQRAGYRTFAATSVMHLKPAQSGLDQGFDRYNAPDQGKRDGKKAAEQLLDWVPEAAGSPLFVWLHVYDAHAPYTPPKKFVDMHYEGKDPKDESRSLGIAPEILGPWIVRSGITDRDFIDAKYAGGVEYADSHVERLLEIDRLAEGIVLFTADHGESLGNAGIWWNHTHLNLDTLHIPLVLRAPGLEPGNCDEAVEMIDAGRTLLNIAGIESNFPGRDIRDAIGGVASRQPRFSLGGLGRSAAIEADGWMLTLQIARYPKKVGERNWAHGATQLFDLSSDPRAEVDVIDEHFQRAKKMRGALIAWLLDAQDVGLGIEVELTDEARASLEALGYGGGSDEENEDAWWEPDPDSPWNKRFEE